MPVRYVRGRNLTPLALRKLAEPMIGRRLSYYAVRNADDWRPRRGQMTRKEQDKAVELIAAWLVSVGAVEGQYYDFDVATIYGTLSVTPYGSWVACRFESAELARPILGHSYSGKWNHHHFDVSGTKVRPTGQELFEHFKAQLSRILACA